MAETKAEGFLQKIDPQMWITLIGFVFTLGLIYGEFQTMKNQITIFEEKQKLFDEDFDAETKMVLEINTLTFLYCIRIKPTSYRYSLGCYSR